jgi:hypothetical protein
MTNRMPVTAPSPGTVRLRYALVDARFPNPVINTIATYAPYASSAYSLASFAFNDGVGYFAGTATIEGYATDATNGMLLWEMLDKRPCSSPPGSRLFTYFYLTSVHPSGCRGPGCGLGLDELPINRDRLVAVHIRSRACGRSPGLITAELCHEGHADLCKWRRTVSTRATAYFRPQQLPRFTFSYGIRPDSAARAAESSERCATERPQPLGR